MQQPTPSPPSVACRRTSACTSVTRRAAFKIICSYATELSCQPASPCTLTCTGAECTAAMQQGNRQEQRLQWWWSCTWRRCWRWRKRAWLVGSLKQKVIVPKVSERQPRHARPNPLPLIRTHTHKHTVSTARVMQVYLVQKNIPFCHCSRSMHPSQTQAEEKWHELRRNTSQCRYTDRQWQAEPYIETVWHWIKTDRSPNCDYDGWMESAAVGQTRGMSLYMTLAHVADWDRQVYRQTDVQTDGQAVGSVLICFSKEPVRQQKNSSCRLRRLQGITFSFCSFFFPLLILSPKKK